MFYAFLATTLYNIGHAWFTIWMMVLETGRFIVALENGLQDAGFVCMFVCYEDLEGGYDEDGNNTGSIYYYLGWRMRMSSRSHTAYTWEPTVDNITSTLAPVT